MTLLAGRLVSSYMYNIVYVQYMYTHATDTWLYPQTAIHTGEPLYRKLLITDIVFVYIPMRQVHDITVRLSMLGLIICS